MRVLVTRPEPGAAKTAARLRMIGHEAVVAPLSRVVAVEGATMPAGAFDAVAVTSANALISASSPLLDAITPLPCFAVGDRTAEAAKDAGFADVGSAGGDVHDLVAMITGRLSGGAEVLYLCGTRRRPVLEDALKDAGFGVTPVETYGIEAVRYEATERNRLIAGAPLDAALVFSRFGAELLSDFLGGQGAPRVICMSRHVADGLSHSLRMSAEIASTPTEDALLALLSRASR
ncbi:MAG: uroporphyrinogen-III synthase [Rhizobiaceae bacterium]